MEEERSKMVPLALSTVVVVMDPTIDIRVVMELWGSIRKDGDTGKLYMLGLSLGDNSLSPVPGRLGCSCSKVFK